MRRHIILIMAILLACLTARATSTVSLSTSQGVPRDTVTVTVDLTTTDAVSAVDITIPLGDWLTYVNGSALLNSARSNGHLISASQSGDNLRILIYSLSLSQLNGTSGELCRFNLVLGSEPGENQLSPTVVLSSSTGANIPVSVNSGSVTINAPRMELSGNVLDFGKVAVNGTHTRTLRVRNTGTDYLNISAITFSNPDFSAPQSYSIYPWWNSEDVVVTYTPHAVGNIVDTMTIVSNAGDGVKKILVKAQPTVNVSELHLLDASGVSDDTVRVYVTMDNITPIVGMQAKFAIPDGLDPIAGSFTVPYRTVNHLAMSSVHNDTLTIMAYSPDNSAFTDNTDTLGYFLVRLNGRGGYSLEPKDVVISDASGNNTYERSTGCWVDITAPRIEVDGTLDFGSVSVTETGRASVIVHNYDNAPLRINQVAFLSEGFSVVNQLPMIIQSWDYDTLWVEYAPSKEGSFSTTMQILSNDPINRVKSVNVSGTVFEPNEIKVKGRCLRDGRYVVTLGLDNYSNITALQMDIHWINGMNTSAADLTLQARAQGMTPMMSKVNSNTYRIALFSMSNRPLLGNSGDVLQLVYNGANYDNSTIVVDNVVASDPKGVNKVSVSSDSLLVEVKYIEATCNTNRGRTKGTGWYNVGDTATLTAIPNADYHLVSWCNGDTSSSISFVVSEDFSCFARIIHNPYLFVENDTICQGASYSWHGLQPALSGVYYDSLKAIDDVDSVYQLNLIVNPTYLFTETQAICQGQTYTWRGRALGVAGVYYDSLLTVAGCDSVYQLTLVVNPIYFMPETQAICQGQSYIWRGRTLTDTGVYYDSLLTSAGCDSVYELSLTVNPVYFFAESLDICQGTSYNWHGRKLAATGVYYDSLLTDAGCDSVYQLNLTVNPTYFMSETQTICQGQSYSWHGRQLAVTGVYFDSLLTDAGCDSVYQLTLLVNHAYKFTESYAICQGYTYTWRGRQLAVAGVYYDSLLAVTGCDSVYELTLTVNPSYLITEDTILYGKKAYRWHGRNLTASGVYYDSLVTVSGCDSVYVLNLTLSSPAVENLTVSDVTYTSFHIEWTKAATGPESMWQVEVRKTDGTVVVDKPTTRLYYDVTGLTDATTYTVIVRPRYSSKSFGDTAQTTLTTPAVPTPAVESLTVSNVTTNSFRITWTKAATGTEYMWQVEVKRPDGTAVVNRPTMRLYYDVAGLTAATTYTVIVRPRYSLKSFGDSATTNATTIGMPAVENLTVSDVTYTSFHIEWTKAATGTESMWQVEVRRPDGTVVVDKPTTRLYYDAMGLTASTTYTINVRPRYSSKSFGDIATTTATTAAVPTPAVENLTVSNVTTKSFHISWTKAATGTESMWQIEIRKPDGTVIVNKPTQRLYYDATGLTASTTYTINVRPRYSSKSFGDTATTTATTAAVPTPAVENLKVSNVKQHSFRVTWRKSQSGTESMWQIEVKRSDGTVVVNKATTRLYYDATGLTASTEYIVTVRPRYSSKSFGDAAQVSQTTLAAQNAPDNNDNNGYDNDYNNGYDNGYDNETVETIAEENLTNETFTPAEAYVNFDRLYVENIVAGSYVTIVDAAGKTICNEKVNDTRFEYGLYVRGIYTVVIRDEKHNQTLKVVY